MVPIERLAELSGQPFDGLTVLDQQVILLAFVDGTFVDHTLRVGSTKQILRLVTTTDGELVDLDRLRQDSRRLVEDRASKMNPQLRRIVERHPDAERLHVRIHSGDGIRADEVTARQATRLLADPTVTYVELIGEPDLLDG